MGSRSRVVALVVGVLVLYAIAKCPSDRPQRPVAQQAPRPEPEPKLCNFWKREATPSERPLVVQAPVEQYLNAYDYVPGCIAHRKNANRISQRINVFCEGSGQSDSIVLSGVKDLAQELCGRR